MKTKITGILILLIIIISVPVFADQEKAEEIYNLVTAKWENGEDATVIIEEAIQIIESEISESMSPETISVWKYRLACLHNSLILDAPTWMKHAGPRNEALSEALKLNPANLPARVLNTRQLLLNLPSDGGNPVQGEILLKELVEEYPDYPELLLLIGDKYKKNGDISGAKSYYQKILEQDPEHIPSKKYVDEISAAESGYIISEMRLSKALKTHNQALVIAVESFIGKPYTLNTANELNEILKSYPSVDGASVSIISHDDDSIIIGVDLSEDNLIVLAVLADSSAYIKYDDSFGFGFYPTAVYIDNNLFGSTLNFTGVFSVVFASAELIIPERKEFPFDTGFSIEGLAIQGETRFYETGRNLSDWSFKSANGSAALFLRKQFDFGLNLKTKHNFSFYDYTSDTPGFTSPSGNVAYTGDFQFQFTNQPVRDTSAFKPSRGYKIEAVPSVVYRFGWEDWGPDGSLYQHNDAPGYKAHYLVGYDFDFLKVMNLGLQITYLHGINLYAPDEWKVGQTNQLNPFPRLSGYYEGEFRTSGSPLLNIDYLIKLPGEQAAITFKHDVFYHGETSEWYQGTGAGIAFRLGDSFELSAQGAYGWNTGDSIAQSWNAGLTFQYVQVW